MCMKTGCTQPALLLRSLPKAQRFQIWGRWRHLNAGLLPRHTPPPVNSAVPAFLESSRQDSSRNPTSKTLSSPHTISLLEDSDVAWSDELPGVGCPAGGAEENAAGWFYTSDGWTNQEAGTTFRGEVRPSTRASTELRWQALWGDVARYSLAAPQEDEDRHAVEQTSTSQEEDSVASGQKGHVVSDAQGSSQAEREGGMKSLSLTEQAAVALAAVRWRRFDAHIRPRLQKRDNAHGVIIEDMPEARAPSPKRLVSQASRDWRGQGRLGLKPSYESPGHSSELKHSWDEDTDPSSFATSSSPPWSACVGSGTAGVRGLQATKGSPLRPAPAAPGGKSKKHPGQGWRYMPPKHQRPGHAFALPSALRL